MTELDLSFSALKNFDSDFPLLVDVLVKHPRLRVLDLTGAGVGVKGLRACEVPYFFPFPFPFPFSYFLVGWFVCLIYRTL